MTLERLYALFLFFIQGLYTVFMEKYVVIVHLLDVITHAIVASLFYKLIVQLGGKKNVALLSALIFLINPMTTIATGWSAALMDRHYILFGLITLLAADRYVRFEEGKIYLLLIFLGSALSILSKETALILPALALIILLTQFELIKSKRFWTACVIWAMPIIVFFIYRLPALIVSFGTP